MAESPATKLRAWYRRHRRQLPWRENPEPYRVWVSELMLQQTQVKTVLPYYERFLARFPDVQSLAAADEQEVLAAWSGLGYYRRAKALHRAAGIIVDQRGGSFPADVRGWLELPGVGRYTAGAIVSIALGGRAAVVDGNVSRVLARFHGIVGNVNETATSRELWMLAEGMLPPRARSAGDHNQALMELGALVCTKSAPKCLLCPLQSACVARREGTVDVLPNTGKKPAPVAVTLGAAVVERWGKLLFFRRSGEKLMEDLWEFPTWECPPGDSPSKSLAREARTHYGVELRASPPRAFARITHSIMNRRIRLYAYDAVLEGPGRLSGEHRWVRERDVETLAVSSMVHKILRARRKDASQKGTHLPLAPPATPELS